MMMKKRWIARSIGSVALLSVLTGCGIFDTVSGEPEKARITIDMSDAPSLELTTSLNFIVTQGNNISFEDLTVDTLTAAFDQQYDIRNYLRLYVLATNIEEQDVTFRMKVTIDGESWYNEEKTLPPEETAQFVYRYQAPIIY